MTKSSKRTFNLKPLTLDDIPSDDAEFSSFLDDYFAMGEKLIDTMDNWNKQSVAHSGTVQVVTLPSGSAYSKIRNELGVNEFWCGRMSDHTTESVEAHTDRRGSGSSARGLVRSLSNRLIGKSADVANGKPSLARRPTFELSEDERQDRVMNSNPRGLYERFRRGLLEYHSENEREYIESCRETECLQVLKAHIAEIWRLTYVTPAPTSPRTFVVLLLSRELRTAPHGNRAFMNISIPFNHSACPEKQGGEKSRVRGKYVSVELVSECDEGARVSWRMATSSDAGGNIPRFVTNASMPSKVSEDVPSFIGWMVKRFPEGGDVDSHPVQV